MPPSMPGPALDALGDNGEGHRAKGRKRQLEECEAPTSPDPKPEHCTAVAGAALEPLIVVPTTPFIFGHRSSTRSEPPPLGTPERHVKRQSSLVRTLDV
jgi:hypothetical protein